MDGNRVAGAVIVRLFLDGFIKALRRENLSAVGKQQLQDLILCGSEIHRMLMQRHLFRPGIQAQIATGQKSGFLLCFDRRFSLIDPITANECSGAS